MVRRLGPGGRAGGRREREMEEGNQKKKEKEKD